MAAPAWFVAQLEALRRVPGARPASAQTLVEWTEQVGDGESPSRPTISRWLSGATLPSDFRALELMVLGVREHTRNPSRQVQETLLRTAWWRDLYDRAVAESGRAAGPDGYQPQVVYQGLAPFRRADADRFFGRENAIEALRARLDTLHRSPPGGPLIVLGPSGAGKSSLLAAGLLPTLERTGLAGDPAVAGWPAVVFTPGADPMSSLADALESQGVSSARSSVVAGAAELADGQRAEPPRGVVVVVDQFEEVFHADEETRDRFVNALSDMTRPGASPIGPGPLAAGNGAGPDSALSAGPDGPRALVIIACRNEYYPQLRELARMRTALDAPFNLDPLTTDELTDAITKPARRVGITVSAELVNRVVSDAGVTSGGTLEGKLPLISHLLHVMNRAGPMTVHGYERAGGIDGAVAHTAEQAWNELQQGGLEGTALLLLVQLVQVSEHPGRDTRRTLERRELLEVTAPARATRTLNILAAARLITIDQDTVQITHDALLHAWQRLRDTIDTERSDIVMRQNIERRARQWEEAGRPQDHLFRGTVLTEAHRVSTVGVRATAMSERARAFLTAADEQEQREATRRRRRRTAGIAAVLVIVVVGAVAVVQSIRQYQISQRAILAEVIAQAKEVRDSDVSLSAQLFLTAYRMQPTPELYTALLETQNRPLSRPLAGHDGRIRSVAYHGATMISAGDDGTIRFWDGQPGRSDGENAPAAAGIVDEPGAVTALAVVPGQPILISSRDNALLGQSALRMWNIADPRNPRPITGDLPTGARELSALATSPDGNLLAATADDGTTQVWRIEDPARPLDLGVRLPGASSNMYGSGIAISPDGATLAVAGDGGTVRMWDIRVPGAPVALPALPSGTRVTRAVAFSPTGGLLASAGGAGVLRTWDVRNPAAARLLDQPETDQSKTILSLAVSPDGNAIAAGDGDNTVTLWNSSDPTDLTRLGEPLTGHSRGVGKVAFSPDGRALLTGGADPVLRVWALPATRLTTSPGLVVEVAFNHNGRTLAVGDVDNSAVRLWDVTNPNAPVPTSPPLVHGAEPTAPGFNVAFSPDDRVLISGAGNLVRRWDVSDPRSPRPIGPDIVLPAAVGGLALSPDGRTLAVGGADGVTRLVSFADPAAPSVLNVSLPGTPGALILAVRFSPDGRVLATAGADGQVWLWDLSNPSRAERLGTPLAGHTDQVFDLAFSPDGQRLASVGFDHTARIWDVSDPLRAHQSGPPLVQQPNVLGSVAWTADGATLATGSHEPSVGLWNVTDPDRPAPIGTPLSGHHSDYVTALGSAPAAPVVASGGKDHTVVVWNLDVRAVVQRLCATTPGVLTERAWDTYVSPDVSYDPPCEAGEDATQRSSAAR